MQSCCDDFDDVGHVSLSAVVRADAVPSGYVPAMPLSSCVVRFHHSCIYTATDGPTKRPADKDKHGNALTRITPFNNIKSKQLWTKYVEHKNLDESSLPDDR